MPRAVIRLIVVLLLLVPPVLIASRSAAAPAVVSQAPITGVVGEIVAWQDSVFLTLERHGNQGQSLHRVRRSSGNSVLYQIGMAGRGFLVGIDPAGGSFLARETDSLGVNQLQRASWPYLQWTPLIPVTDPDPHVTWFPDGKSFLYQDILDDSLGTPSVFRFAFETGKSKLYMVGTHRPLIAPSGDAIACVGVDTLNPGTTRDIEQRQPVGVEDLKAGEFKWVAPLRTHVPNRGAWSPDGARLALIGYGIDSTGASERRVYVYTRYTGDSKRIILPGDTERADREHAIDVATWSPDGKWIAIGRMNGQVWLINSGGTQVFELKPKEGAWRGVPLWTDPTHFVIAQGSAKPGAGATEGYWMVEVGGL